MRDNAIVQSPLQPNGDGIAHNANSSASTPSLDAIAADPRRAADLPRETAFALLSRCAAVQLAIAATLALTASNDPSAPVASAIEDTRTIPIETVLRDLGVSRRWLFARAGRPGYAWIKRISRKRIAILEAGYRRYLASRPRA